jgi:hypothetical protein
LPWVIALLRGIDGFEGRNFIQASSQDLVSHFEVMLNCFEDDAPFCVIFMDSNDVTSGVFKAEVGPSVFGFPIEGQV